MMQFGSDRGVALPCSSNSVQSTNSPSSAAPAPIRKRRFSSAKIQPTRVKKVMQSDEEIGRMVASVPVAIGRAMEHFAEKFLEAAALCVQCSTSRTLSPAHMKQAMSQYRHFAFLEPLLKDIALPTRISSELVWNPEPMPQPPLPMMISTPTMDGYYAPAPAALMNQLSPQMPVQSYIHQAMSSSPIMQPLLQQPSALPSCAQPLLSNTAQQHQQQQQSPLQSPLSSIPSNNFLPLTATKRRQNNGTMSAASTSSTVSDAPPDGKPKRGRPRKVKKEEKCVDDEGLFVDNAMQQQSRSHNNFKIENIKNSNGLSFGAPPLPPAASSVLPQATSSSALPPPTSLSDSQLMPPPCLPLQRTIISPHPSTILSPAATQLQQLQQQHQHQQQFMPIQSIPVPSSALTTPSSLISVPIPSVSLPAVSVPTADSIPVPLQTSVPSEQSAPLSESVPVPTVSVSEPTEAVPAVSVPVSVSEPTVPVPIPTVPEPVPVSVPSGSPPQPTSPPPAQTTTNVITPLVESSPLPPTASLTQSPTTNNETETNTVDSYNISGNDNNNNDNNNNINGGDNDNINGNNNNDNNINDNSDNGINNDSNINETTKESSQNS